MKRYLVNCLIIYILSLSCSDNDEPLLPQPAQTGTFTDERDGREYRWVRYGDLEWMVENLRYEPTSGNYAPKELTPEWNNAYDDGKNSAYYEIYGRLYDFHTAREAALEGWRLPTDADWQSLEKALGMSADEAMASGKRGSLQGDWLQDKNGVNLQLGGYLIPDERNLEVDTYTSIYALYWTDTVDENKPNEGFAYCRQLTYNSSQVMRESVSKNYLLSVRCVRKAIQ